MGVTTNLSPANETSFVDDEPEILLIHSRWSANVRVNDGALSELRYLYLHWEPDYMYNICTIYILYYIVYITVYSNN